MVQLPVSWIMQHKYMIGTDIYLYVQWRLTLTSSENCRN